MPLHRTTLLALFTLLGAVASAQNDISYHIWSAQGSMGAPTPFFHPDSATLSGSATTPKSTNTSISSYALGSNSQGVSWTNGLATSSFTTNVTSAPGNYSSTGTTETQNISFSFADISFTADDITATSTIFGALPGNASFTSGVTFTNPVLTINGVSIVMPTSVSSSNDIIYSASGLTIVANKRTGILVNNKSAGLDSTGLVFEFAGFQYGNNQTMNGDAIFGHNMILAQPVANVPEPTSILALSGLALCFVRRHRSKVKGNTA